MTGKLRGTARVNRIDRLTTVPPLAGPGLHRDPGARHRGSAPAVLRRSTATDTSQTVTGHHEGAREAPIASGGTGLAIAMSTGLLGETVGDGENEPGARRDAHHHLLHDAAPFLHLTPGDKARPRDASHQDGISGMTEIGRDLPEGATILQGHTSLVLTFVLSTSTHPILNIHPPLLLRTHLPSSMTSIIRRRAGMLRATA